MRSFKSVLNLSICGCSGHYIEVQKLFTENRCACILYRFIDTTRDVGLYHAHGSCGITIDRAVREQWRSHVWEGGGWGWDGLAWNRMELSAQSPWWRNRGRRRKKGVPICISPTASVCDICCKCVRAIRKIYYIRLPSRVYNIIYILCMYITTYYNIQCVYRKPRVGWIGRSKLHIIMLCVCVWCDRSRS